MSDDIKVSLEILDVLRNLDRWSTANIKVAGSQDAITKATITFNENTKQLTATVTSLNHLNEIVYTNLERQGNTWKTVATTVRTAAESYITVSDSLREVLRGYIALDPAMMKYMNTSNKVEVDRVRGLQKIQLEQEKTAQKAEEQAQREIAAGKRSLAQYEAEMMKYMNTSNKVEVDRVRGLQKIQLEQEKAAQKAEEQAQREIAAGRKIIALYSEEQAAKRRASYATRFTNRIQAPADLRSLSTTGELFNYNSALSKLREFITTNDIGTRRISSMWRDASQGISKVYAGELGKMQTLMFGVVSAQDKLATSPMPINSLQAFNQELGKVNAGSQSMLLSWQSILRIVAGQMIRMAFYNILGYMQETFKVARDLSTQIGLIQSISQSNKLTTEEWRKGLIELSNAYGGPVLDQASAAYEALQNQITQGADTFRFLKAANELAVVSAVTTKEAVELLSSSLNAYNGTVDDARTRSELWFKAVDLGRFYIKDIANSLGTVLVVAKELGAAEDEVAAALITITRHGVKPAVAMTQLRGVMNELIKPSKELQKIFAEFGYPTGEAMIAANSFAGTLEILSERFKGNTSDIGKAFNEMRGFMGIMGITGDRTKEYTAALNELRNGVISYDEALNTVMGTSGKQLDIFTNQLKNSLLEGTLQPLLDMLANITKALDSSGLGVSTLSIGIRTLAASLTLLLIPALFQAEKALMTLSLGLGKVGKIVGGTLVVVTIGIEALTYYYDKIAESGEKADEMYEKLQETIRKVEQERAKTIAKISQGIDDSIKDTLKLIAGMTSVHNKNIKGIEESYKHLKNAINEVVKNGTAAYNEMISNLNKQYNEYTANVKKGLEEIVEIKRKTGEELFDYSLTNMSLNQRIALTKRQFDAIMRAANDSVGAGNRKQVDNHIKEAERLFKEVFKAQEDADKQNNKNAERRSELNKALAKKEADYIIKEQQLRDKLDIAKRTKNYREIAKAQSELSVLHSKATKDVAILTGEYRSIKDIEFKRMGYAESLITLREKEIKIIQRQGDVEEEAAKKVAMQKVIQAKLADDLAVASKTMAALSITDINKITSKDELNKQLGIYRNALQQYITLRQNPALSTKLTDDQLSTLREQGLQIEQAVDERGLVIYLDELRIKNENLTKSLKDQLVVVEKTRKEYGDVRQALEGYAKEAPGALEKLHEYLWNESRFDVSDTARRQEYRRLEEFKRDFPTYQKSLMRSLESGNIEGIVRTASKLLPELNKIRTWQAEQASAGVSFSLDALHQFQVLASLENQLKVITRDQSKYKDIQKNENAIKEAYIQTGQAVDAVKAAMVDYKAEMIELISIQGQLKESTLEYNKAALGSSLSQYIMEQMGSFPVVPFATGGSVGTDRVSAMLSPGEFVMNSKATSRFFSQLVAMNASTRGFASGGYVTNVGDINISLQPSGNESVDVAKIGRLLHREIRRGTLRRF